MFQQYELTEPSQIVVRVTPELHREFRIATVTDGTSMKAVIKNAIVEYVRARSVVDPSNSVEA